MLISYTHDFIFQYNVQAEVRMRMMKRMKATLRWQETEIPPETGTTRGQNGHAPSSPRSRDELLKPRLKSHPNLAEK